VGWPSTPCRRFVRGWQCRTPSPESRGRQKSGRVGGEGACYPEPANAAKGCPVWPMPPAPSVHPPRVVLSAPSARCWCWRDGFPESRPATRSSCRAGTFDRSSPDADEQRGDARALTWAKADWLGSHHPDAFNIESQTTARAARPCRIPPAPDPRYRGRRADPRGGVALDHSRQRRYWVDTDHAHDAIALRRKAASAAGSGRFTATYKYAVLLGLIDLCWRTPRGVATGDGLTTRQLAERSSSSTGPTPAPIPSCPLTSGAAPEPWQPGSQRRF